MIDAREQSPAVAHDLEVPVILMTGQPDVASAIRAVEYGAFRCLVKPVPGQDLWDAALRAARLRKLARLKEHALQLEGTGRRRLGERAALEVRFSLGMSPCSSASRSPSTISGLDTRGLTSFTLLDPAVAKLDMSLVRGIDTDTRRKAII